jgi:hypothetical protein
MIKGTPAKEDDAPMRGTSEMTMAEAFKLAAPRLNTGRI